MERRTLIGLGVSGLAVGAVGLKHLATRDLPLYVNNWGDSEHRITATVTDRDADETVFEETVDVPPDATIDRTVEGLEKTHTNIVTASTEDGQRKQHELSSGDRSISLRVDDDGELTIAVAVN